MHSHDDSEILGMTRALNAEWWGGELIWSHLIVLKNIEQLSLVLFGILHVHVFIKMEGRKIGNMIVGLGNSEEGDQLAFVLDVSSSVQF